MDGDSLHLYPGKKKDMIVDTATCGAYIIQHVLC